MVGLPSSQATKGSQKWIQFFVNQKPEIINKEIALVFSLPDYEKIEWLSPLKEEKFKEYKDEEFLIKLGINPEKVKLDDFWPKSGPRWDALAKSSLDKLFLVEAKSHITELISDFKGTNPNSKSKIERSLNKTKRWFGVNATYDWTKLFYQHANRLAHVNWLRENGFDA
jgi:hypothetical protein